MDALPAIVPFFGATIVSLLCGFTCLSRRVNMLQRRLEMVEQMRQAQVLQPPPPTPQILPTPPLTQPWMYQSYPTPSAPPMGNRYV